VGDIPSVGRDYLTTAPNEQITDDQVAAFPAEVGEAVRELVGEYEARTSLEAQVARDADKLECLIQAREYEVQGYANVTPWVRAADTVPKASRGYDAAKKINGRKRHLAVDTLGLLLALAVASLRVHIEIVRRRLAHAFEVLPRPALTPARARAA
jgi:5'-deoxynucleotidase YfbR-like HD superfamily hydrolase